MKVCVTLNLMSNPYFTSGIYILVCTAKNVNRKEMYFYRKIEFLQRENVEKLEAKNKKKCKGILAFVERSPYCQLFH